MSPLIYQAHCDTIPQKTNTQEAKELQDFGPKYPIPGNREGNQRAVQVKKSAAAHLLSGTLLTGALVAAFGR